MASGDYKSDTNRRDQMQTSLLIVDSRVTLLFSQFSLNMFVRARVLEGKIEVERFCTSYTFPDFKSELAEVR